MNYKEAVLQSNKALRETFKSLGQCRSALLTLNDSKDNEFKLPNAFVSYLIDTKKDREKYEILKANTRLTKKGGITPFYLLQALYRLNK